MLKYLNFVNELFNSPMGISWFVNDKNKMEGVFTQKHNRYVIDATQKYKDIWSYSFYLSAKNLKIYQIDDINVNQYVVLSTVIKGFNFLIKQKNPKIVFFHCKKTENSKLKLYDKLLNDTDWNLKKVETNKNYLFVLYKDTKVINLVDKLIKSEVKADKK